ncbi:hypothetical protein [Streptomyces buecherae]|uniref:Uncharacterized protein n=1 Tax=Streptomyces buecherae TaxID=2763006 RepID=A0A7H8N1X7_9ACTN|nr:hypothetical protein [Streptomyces buecherae]QKW48351.1 hypothetical protein HUT08_00980 [Streptomyces buecherae]
MDRRALREALHAARVSDDYYWIEGVHEPRPTPVDHLFLRGDEGGGWQVGAYERGASEVIAVHGDEATACAHLLALLT